MTSANRAFLGLGRGLALLLAAVGLGLGGGARAQLVSPISVNATVGQSQAITVTIPLQFTLGGLAPTYGSTSVFSSSDPTTVLAFSLLGISMPVTIQKLYSTFPGATVTINSLNLSITGDSRFTLSAGTCASPSGPSCKATASYNGMGPAGSVVVKVKASVPSISISGAGALGAYLNAVYPLFASFLSNNLTVDVRVSIAAAAVVDTANHTALWWNPLESGWGVNLNHQGDTVFATLFTYDNLGAPLWLVMSSGAKQAGTATYEGALYRTTGPAFNATPFTPIGPSNLTEVGRMSIAFDDEDHATLTYGINGIVVTKAIRRQLFGSRQAQCVTTAGSRDGLLNFQDLWWNSAESGWGINLTHQDDILFATLFTYDTTGQGLWLVMSAGLRQPDGSFTGDLYRTSGPPFNAEPFTPIGAANLAKVGTMTLRFTDGAHAKLTYTVNGTTVTKDIARQVFSSPMPSCS